jgi:L,D-transpeptidase YcbB
LSISAIRRCGSPAGVYRVLLLMDICSTRTKARLYAAAIILAMTAFGAGVLPASQTSPLIEQMSHCIRERMTDRDHLSDFVCRGEPISGIQLMPAVYEERRFEPLWLDSRGLRPTAQALIRTIEQADREGLRPSDYHLNAIQSLLADMSDGALPLSPDRAGDWADADMLLTDAFLLFSSHLSAGRVNPETLHNDCVNTEKTIDIMKGLPAVVTGAQFDQFIEQLSPDNPDFLRLRDALHRLQAVADKGGWPTIPEGPVLKAGDHDMRVLMLRDRLRIGGDLYAQVTSDIPDHFDDPVVEAVKRFQSRHGLEPDGSVGPQTLEELNIPARARVRQIELNMERWRWLPHDLGRRHIVVNTAAFDLAAVEDHRVVLRMRVVVGRPARRTPVFSAPMQYMVINPSWTVPPTIAVEDILPRLVEDAGYLEHQTIKVYRGWDDNAAPIDPHDIDWRAYGRNNFPFRLVQEPGSNNPLGRFKFMFPNRFSVYLHDTPNHRLFGKVQRDFSSGCIRVEEAPSLAAFLLEDDTEWSAARLRSVVRKGREQVIRIKEPVTVHLLYMTAWVDENGELQFRRDIYQRDKDLGEVLEAKAPALSPLMEAGMPSAVR